MGNGKLASLALLCTTSLVSSLANAEEFVCLDTSEGDICLRMLTAAAPVTVANFLRYVDDGDYDQTFIHRSDPHRFIQGGGYSFAEEDFALHIATNPPIANEPSLSNVRGTVSMAQLAGNQHSATSEWFINIADNSYLDRAGSNTGYTVFAEVVAGMDLVDLIGGFSLWNGVNELQNSALDTVPVDIDASTTQLDLEHFVVIDRAYRTDQLPGEALLPWQCSADSPGNTLTEFCGSTVHFPVSVDGMLFEARIALVATSPAMRFAVERASLLLLEDTGQERAVYADERLTIPSVRVNDKVYVNVILDLTDKAALEFTLSSFTLY